LFHVERLTRLWKNSRDSGVIAQLFHVEQSPASAHVFVGQPTRRPRVCNVSLGAQSRPD
jgi:hypothetical protein